MTKKESEVLTMISTRQEQMLVQISQMDTKLDRILDPETGIYQQVDSLAGEIRIVKGDLHRIKTGYKWVIGIAVFVGIALRDIAVRLIAKHGGQ